MKTFEYYINAPGINETKLGLSKSVISELKNMKRSISYSELQKMSYALKIPISTLLNEYNQKEVYKVLFRGDENSENKIGLYKLEQFIENILELSPATASNLYWQNEFTPIENTIVNSEKLSIWFRNTFFKENLEDPLTDLPEVLSNQLNIVVKVLELGNNSDGASAIVKGVNFIFVSPRFQTRMLFTIAHELGHLLNHHNNKEYFHLDKNININTTTSNELERFANHFASALLLPSVGVGAFIATYRELNEINLSNPISDIELIYLSHFYGVSFDVAAMRCEILGLLPRGGAASLSNYIAEQFGNPEKRAKDLGISDRGKINFPPLANFINKNIIKLIEVGDYSVGKISDMLDIPVKEILNFRSQID